MATSTGRPRPLARRAAAFPPSVWEEVSVLVARYPGIITFGNGAPAPELIPAARLRQGAARAWAEADGNLGYGEVEGYGPLRELICARMANQGTIVDPASVLVTFGSQQGIDLITRLLVDPGDTVVIEGPTYIGGLQVFDAWEAAYLVAPVDAEGMGVAALAQALDRLDRPPKLIYTIPTFQNPTGVTMTLPRRQALVALARERGLLIVEDDPYGEIYVDGPPEPSLRALDPDVVYLGTFSKTIAPGIRVGWMVAPDDLIGPLTMAKEVADIHSDRMAMRTVYHTAVDFLDEHLIGLRQAYRRRRDALLAGLSDHMPPGVRWFEPAGGFFVWVTLPNDLSARELLPLAAAHGVAFLPGSWFHPNGEERSSLRLSYSALPEDSIDEGARRLGAAIRAFGGVR